MAEKRFPIWPFIFSLAFGLLYLGVGTVELLTEFGLLSISFVSKDAIQSLMLLIVGTVFLSGTPTLYRRDREGYAFTLVGATLAALLFILQILVLGSNALGWILGFGDWVNWSIFSDLTTSVWLFALLLVVYAGLWVTGKIDGNSKLFPKGE